MTIPHPSSSSRPVTTNPFASRLRSSAVIAGGLLFAALIGVAYGVVHRPPVAAAGASAVAAPDAAGIIPTDVMGMSSPWSPLTGDSSN